MSRHFFAHPSRSQRQRGATLVVGLIMLVLITFVVVNAFNLSSSNLKAVGNVQVRNEAIAAANRYIEQLIATPTVFTVAAPGGYQTVIDLNNDAARPNNYTVNVAEPACVRALIAATVAPSDVELGPAIVASTTWDVDFEIVATVTDQASGADVEIRQGVRVRMSEFEKDAKCP